ncbi:hypothetical protein JMJ35_001109 [Cladonia borealis]|uniref:Uncharacterized protein n=1 Tax=Cladonia borealis TaxID=184061 RepID=A0AA39UEE7_9LECA|nr:hypothetical protein JMJ35_001109 [Cladonia borealis]
MASPGRQFDMTGALDLESQDIRPNPPLPQPASEFQHHTSLALRAWKGFSRIIRTMLFTSENPHPKSHENDLWVAARELKSKEAQFWMDYDHVKDRPCAPVGSLFCLTVKLIVQPPHGLDTTEYQPGHEICLSDWLESVHEALIAQSSDSLMLCSLTAENPKSNSGLLYKALNCLPSQVQSRTELPRRALIYLLSRRPDWHLRREVVQELAKADAPPEIEQYQGLPSESKDCMSLTLRWACTVPKYKGKLATYIWQPFRKSPPFAYVTIFVSNRENPRNLRIVLLFQNRDSRTSFQKNYGESQTFGGGATWFPALDGASAIIVAYKHVLKETSEFLRQASKQIMALFREVAEKMQAFVPQGTPFVGDEIFRDLKTDSDFILAELTKLERETDDLIHEIEFRRRFDQNSNTLTMLALLYVPLSFATSFMGMLLTDHSAPSASQISSASSNSALSPSPNVTYNTIVPAPSPGPRLWDMKMFGYLAAPLLFGTIVMPLISGTLLRFVVKTHTRLMPWYHLAFAVLWLLGLVYYDASQHFVTGIFRICFDSPVVAVVVHQTYRAFRKKVCRTLYSLFLVAGTAAWAIFVVAALVKYGLDNQQFHTIEQISREPDNNINTIKADLVPRKKSSALRHLLRSH